MKSILVLFGAVLLLSCGSVKKGVDHMIPEADVMGLAHFGNLNTESDTYTIKSVRIEENKMILQVEFSGGCINFIPDMIGSEFLMKSLPPKRNIKFVLKKEGECRELKNKQFVFDISDFAYKKEKGSEIILLLENYNKPLCYIYN
jgi:hypothetical protein